MKKCYRCKEEKSVELFCKNRAKKDGLTSECKSCISDLGKIRLENKLKENPEYYKEWYSKQKDSVKKYHTKNKEKITEKRKETSKSYYQKNRDIIVEKNRSYSKSDHGKAKKKEWYLRTREARKDDRKNYMLKRAYGITLDQYKKLCDDQNNKCRICKKEQKISTFKKGLVVDHCHSTGKVRGLLCSPCNTALGLFYDDISVLKSAVSYLQ